MKTGQVAMAAELASRVHASQTDKIGQSYIEHPRRVFQNLLNYPGLAEGVGVANVDSALAAAWLHDVVEDSAAHFDRQVTLDELTQLGFDATTVEVVRLLTRNLEANRAGETYYTAIANNAVARVVKLADIIDNLQPWRVEQLEVGKRGELQQKYAAALEHYSLTEKERDWMNERHSNTGLPEHGSKKILYFDMDNVLVDFKTGIDRLPASVLAEYTNAEGELKDIDECPGIFGLMDPMPGAVEAFHELSELFDVYILSTAPWKNPSAWSDKIDWVHRHLGIASNTAAHKRLIISHNKHLNRGHYLIDDRPNNGAKKFGEIPGQEWIHFGGEQFPGWPAVVAYLKAVA